METDKIVYMDKVDFDYELGEALGGNRVYPSIEDLKKHHSCVKSCGIVKVKISLEEVIQESDFKSNIEKAKSRHQMNTKEEKIKLLNRYQKLVDKTQKEIDDLKELKNAKNG